MIETKKIIDLKQGDKIQDNEGREIQIINNEKNGIITYYHTFTREFKTKDLRKQKESLVFLYNYQE